MAAGGVVTDALVALDLLEMLPRADRHAEAAVEVLGDLGKGEDARGGAQVVADQARALTTIAAAHLSGGLAVGAVEEYALLVTGGAAEGVGHPYVSMSGLPPLRNSFPMVRV